ncbi:MAG: ribonuclease III [Anaerolineales bacterium]|nr:ribonuclease III [Anaerolineales bacterium]
MPLPQFKNPAALNRALIHRSYLNENDDAYEDNERLEFLGDAVLDLVAAEMLYRCLPEMQEGRLTRLRASLVSTERLAMLAQALGLGPLIRMGKGEEASGGRTRPSMLSDTFEAVIGAYYLDSGLQAVREFVEPLFAPLLEQVIRDDADVDNKSLLQEWAQAERRQMPRYQVVAESGPDHERTFIVQVSLGDEVVGQGEGRSKRAAEQAAAADARRRLGLT